MPSALRRLSLSPAPVVLALLLLAAPEARAQVCEGDVELRTQAEVDAFACMEVTWDLRIGPSTDIADLSGLSSLTTVGRAIRIFGNPLLTDLHGLEGVATLGGLVITANAALANVDGLAGAAAAGDNFGLTIDSNALLADIDGLSGITGRVVGITITKNPRLTHLDPLAGITAVHGLSNPLTGSVRIEYNDALVSVSGLGAITTIGDELRFFWNDQLPNLDGLTALTTVGRVHINNNPSLTDVDGLAALTSVRNTFDLERNPSLSDIDGLAALTSVGSSFDIIHNLVLENLDGLSALTSVGRDFRIQSNDALTGVDGLGALTSVEDDLLILENGALENLDGLSALTSVGEHLGIFDNDALTDIDGLSALTSVGESLSIASNDALANLDGLAALEYVGWLVGWSLRVEANGVLGACTVGLAHILSAGGDENLYIEDNAPGCNSVCEVLETCPVANEDDPALVTGLAPLHPNPARGDATLTYTLAAPASVTLTVYDALGRHVQTLAEGEHPAGVHEAVWASNGLPAGVYVVRLAVGGDAWTQRVTLVR